MFATVRVPLVPLSVKVRRVLGVFSASLILNVPLIPWEASLIVGVLLDKLNGRGDENVAIPEAAKSTTPVTFPAFVTPPLLLLIPPVTDRPPDDIVCKP